MNVVVTSDDERLLVEEIIQISTALRRETLERGDVGDAVLDEEFVVVETFRLVAVDGDSAESVGVVDERRSIVITH